MQYQIDKAGCYIIEGDTLAPEIDSQLFSSDYWLADNNTESLQDGRGGTLKIQFNDQDIVLRQYRRGGLVRLVSTDRYLWFGLKHSRPWREIAVLQQARALGLPVPQPIAACVCKSGFSYRGGIMTRFIAGTRSLSDHLGEQELDAELWKQLGSLLRQFHQAKIKHADLNASNILIDGSSHFHLVDFDKARIMDKVGDWQWKPLYRLQQSLQKWQKSRRLIYREENWQSLMDGYQA